MRYPREGGSPSSSSNSGDEGNRRAVDPTAVEQKLVHFKSLYNSYRQGELTAQIQSMAKGQGQATRRATREHVQPNTGPSAHPPAKGSAFASAAARPDSASRSRRSTRSLSSSMVAAPAPLPALDLTPVHQLLGELGTKDRTIESLQAQLSKLRSQLHLQEAREDEQRASLQRQVQELNEQLTVAGEQIRRLETERWEVLEAVSSVAAGSLQLDREQRELERARLELVRAEKEVAAREALCKVQPAPAPEHLSLEDLARLASQYAELEKATMRADSALRRRLLMRAGQDPDAAGDQGGGRGVDLSHDPGLRYLQELREGLLVASSYLSTNASAQRNLCRVEAAPVVRHLLGQAGGLGRVLVLLASEAEADAARLAQVEALSRERNSMLEAAIAESRKLAAQVVAAPALAQELDEQRKENAALQARFKATRKKLKSAFEVLAAANKDLREKLVAAQSNSSQDVARLTGQVEKLQLELTASAERLTAQQQRDVQLVADLAEAKRAAVDALEQAQQLSGELAAARDRADAAQQRGQELEAEVQRSRGNQELTVSAHKAEMEDIHAEFKQQLQLVVDAYSEELCALHEQLAHMDAQVQAQARDLARRSAASAGNGGGKAQAAAVAEAERKAAAAGAQQAEAWRKAYEEARELCHALRMQLDEAEGQNTQLQVQVQRLAAAAANSAAPARSAASLPTPEPPSAAAPQRFPASPAAPTALVAALLVAQRLAPRSPSGGSSRASTPLPSAQQQQQPSSGVPILPDGGRGRQGGALQRPCSPRCDESTQTSRRWQDSEVTVAGGHGMLPSGEDDQRHQRQDCLPQQHHAGNADKERKSQRSVPDDPEQQKQSATDNQAGQDRQDGQLIKAYHHREDSPAEESVRTAGPHAAAGAAQPGKQQQVTVVEVEDAHRPSTGGGRSRGSAERDEGSSDGEEVDEDVEEEGCAGEGGEREDSGSESSIYDLDTTVLGMHVLGLQQQLAALTHQNSVITSQVIELRQQQEAQRLESARSSRGGMSGASPRGSHATASQPNSGRWREEAPAPLSAERSTPSAAALPVQPAATGDRLTSVQQPPPASAAAECTGGEGPTSSQRQQQSGALAVGTATHTESEHAGLDGPLRDGAEPVSEGKQRSVTQGDGQGHAPGGGPQLQQQGQQQEEHVQVARSPEARRELATMREQYALLQGRYEEQAARQRELQELLLRLSGGLAAGVGPGTRGSTVPTGMVAAAAAASERLQTTSPASASVTQGRAPSQSQMHHQLQPPAARGQGMQGRTGPAAHVSSWNTHSGLQPDSAALPHGHSLGQEARRGQRQLSAWRDAANASVQGQHAGQTESGWSESMSTDLDLFDAWASEAGQAPTLDGGEHQGSELLYGPPASVQRAHEHGQQATRQRQQSAPVPRSHQSLPSFHEQPPWSDRTRLAQARAIEPLRVAVVSNPGPPCTLIVPTSSQHPHAQPPSQQPAAAPSGSTRAFTAGQVDPQGLHFHPHPHTTSTSAAHAPRHGAHFSPPRSPVATAAPGTLLSPRSGDFITTTPFFPLGPETSGFLDRATSVDVGRVPHPDLLPPPPHGASGPSGAHSAGQSYNRGSSMSTVTHSDPEAENDDDGDTYHGGDEEEEEEEEDDDDDVYDDEEGEVEVGCAPDGASGTASSAGTTASSSDGTGALMEPRSPPAVAAAMAMGLGLVRPRSALPQGADAVQRQQPFVEAGVALNTQHTHTTRSFLPVTSDVQGGAGHGPSTTSRPTGTHGTVSAASHQHAAGPPEQHGSAPSFAFAGRQPPARLQLQLPGSPPNPAANTLDGPPVPPEVLATMAQYAGDEGLARPSTAAPSVLRPDAADQGPPVPAEVLSYLEQYTGGGEGDVRPSTASPSVLRTGGLREAPVPPEVLSYAQQYTGEEGRARPSTAAPSVLSATRSLPELPVPELVQHIAAQFQTGGEGISRPTTAPSSDERRSRLSLGAVAPSPVLLPELLGGVHQAMSSPTGPSGAASQRLPGQQQHLEQREAVEAAGDEVADVSLAGSFRRTHSQEELMFGGEGRSQTTYGNMGRSMAVQAALSEHASEDARQGSFSGGGGAHDGYDTSAEEGDEEAWEASMAEALAAASFASSSATFSSSLRPAPVPSASQPHRQQQHAIPVVWARDGEGGDEEDEDHDGEGGFRVVVGNWLRQPDPPERPAVVPAAAPAAAALAGGGGPTSGRPGTAAGRPPGATGRSRLGPWAETAGDASGQGSGGGALGARSNSGSSMGKDSQEGYGPSPPGSVEGLEEEEEKAAEEGSGTGAGGNGVSFRPMGRELAGEQPYDPGPVDLDPRWVVRRLGAVREWDEGSEWERGSGMSY